MERPLALSSLGALPYAAATVRQGHGSQDGIGRNPHAPPGYW